MCQVITERNIGHDIKAPELLNVFKVTFGIGSFLSVWTQVIAPC